MSREKMDSLTGSAPRSSVGIYNKASEKLSSLFSPNKASTNRLLSVPVETLRTSFGTSPETSASSGSASSGSAALGSPALGSAASGSASSGSSFWRYLVVFLILVFLAFNLLLFLIKPIDADISHLYDPVINYFTSDVTPRNVAVQNNDAAVHKLEHALNKKEVINNIDNKKPINKKSTDKEPIDKEFTDKEPIAKQPIAKPVKNYKKLPVIPEADDSTSNIQMASASKSGFCYIGEDRGFRNCIEVGEGDTCMSGSIFPTEAICINPNLRE